MIYFVYLSIIIMKNTIICFILGIGIACTSDSGKDKSDEKNIPDVQIDTLTEDERIDSNRKMLSARIKAKIIVFQERR